MSKAKDLTNGGIIEGDVKAGVADNMPEAITPIDQLPESIKTTVSPLAGIIKSIAGLPQDERLVLYSRMDVIMNDDRQKASHGVDNVGHLFDEAINSLYSVEMPTDKL